MDKEKVAHLHNGVLLSGKKKKNDILIFADKWMELEQNHSEWDNPDPESQIQYVFTYKWILKDNQP